MSHTHSPTAPLEANASLESQFNHDLIDVPRRLTDAQQQALIERARTGDKQARDALILDLVPYVKVVVTKYMAFYAWATPRIEFLDLVQIGLLRACEYLSDALASENPCGYLRVRASSAIIRYCNRYASLIRSDYTHDNGCLPPLHVESIETPINEETGETWTDVLAEPEPAQDATRDYVALHEAVKRLPKRQAEVITCYFGLAGEAETLESIEQRFRKPGTSGKTNNASTYKKKALRKLAQRLETVYLSA